MSGYTFKIYSVNQENSSIDHAEVVLPPEKTRKQSWNHISLHRTLYNSAVLYIGLPINLTVLRKPTKFFLNWIYCTLHLFRFYYISNIQTRISEQAILILKLHSKTKHQKYYEVKIIPLADRHLLCYGHRYQLTLFIKHI